MLEQELLDASELISLSRATDLRRILIDCGQLGHDEAIESVAVAGDGNMNCTLRVCTDQRNVIVKQSRPWVEKYPAIPAPMNRALYEIQFYEAVAGIPRVAARMPKLIGFDRDRHLLLLEDLGEGKDGTFLYNEFDASQLANQIPILAQWLAELHNQTANNPALADFSNRELRQLNHTHIFEIPFQSPAAIDLDSITPGLNEIGRQFSEHTRLVERANELGELYLNDGDTLLHGDFFPGSWLFTSSGLFVIDPEFCFAGRAEFDLAVCAAHLRMMGAGEEKSESLFRVYEELASPLDRKLVNGWAGIEIIRRLLGVAQLPLARTLEEKQLLLDWAKNAVLGGTC